MQSGKHEAALHTDFNSKLRLAYEAKQVTDVHVKGQFYTGF